MTEYMVSTGYIMDTPANELYREGYENGYTDGHTAALHGIVRCRDCKNFHPREDATLTCRFEHPSIPNTVEWCYAEPDGYCAWGERRSE